MTDIKLEIETRTNERIEYRIPDGLILMKSDDQSTRDITVYDLIAHHVGLSYVGQDIYVNESGEEYIRTKYGFESAIRYNQNIKILESERLIDELQYKLKIAREKTEKYGEIIKVLEAKSREQKEKLKKVTSPFQDENEALRQEIKQLIRELPEFKQINESVIGKLKRLIKQANERTSTESSNKSKLDWSTYNDLLADNDE
ncbi:MAG: hypothetical protein HRU69_13945 [Flammeovirgaceae bacterium]|nr:MAG: hypothetical protein HRU69_13945 [Flammeovirgaceae bacterium]